MFFKKIFRFAVAVSSLAVLSIGLLSHFSDAVTIPTFIHSSKHSLTGLDGEDGPVIAVKIDDTAFAHPQVGIKEADVVYIEQVEGGLTRLAAIYSSQLPAKVGPVRSARISDIELLSQYGKVGFAYSGAHRLMWPVIDSANLYNLGATHYGPQFYANELARVIPYAMMLDLKALKAESDTRGNLLAQSRNMGWNFGSAPEGMKPFTKIHISWPASAYELSWSQDEGRILLTHSGVADLDADGYHLGPKTFVIQIVSITDSIYHDKVGGVTPFSATVGEGDCYIVRDGGYLPCRWSRTSTEAGTTFTSLSGQEILFDRGQIWFALTSQEPEFTR